MKEIKIKLADKECEQYVKKGIRISYTYKKSYRKDEEYVKWMFMLGEYYRCQRNGI